VIACFVEVFGLKLPVVGEKVKREGGNLTGITVSNLHDVFLAFIELATAALQVRASLLDHSPQLLQIVHSVSIYQVLQHRVGITLLLPFRIIIVRRQLLPRFLHFVFFDESETGEKSALGLCPAPRRLREGASPGDFYLLGMGLGLTRSYFTMFLLLEMRLRSASGSSLGSYRLKPS
jgi:hypothetical protein